MTPLAEVRLSHDHHQLILAVGSAIAKHTAKSPMTVEAIVGVLGFCAGAAIVKGVKSDSNRRDLRAVAMGNIDSGMDAMHRAVSGSSLIIPGMH